MNYYCEDIHNSDEQYVPEIKITAWDLCKNDLLKQQCEEMFNNLNDELLEG